jgi:hypothetical protein
MELISYLLHNSYSIILGLTAIAVMATIAVILLSILQETYLTAEPSDGKTKSRPKDGVRNLLYLKMMERKLLDVKMMERKLLYLKMR